MSQSPKARRFGPVQCNAVPLSPAEHQALMAEVGRSLAAFARPSWRTSREMHQAAERMANCELADLFQ